MGGSRPGGVPLSNNPGLTEAGAGQAGTMPMASRGDHTHPRLSATANGTLNGSGEATVTFTRSFPGKPAVIITYVEASEGQPLVFKVKSWVQAGGTYTGCVIKAYRSQTVPQNLATLLLGGVFNLFAGSASGVEYNLIAIQPST